MACHEEHRGSDATNGAQKRTLPRSARQGKPFLLTLFRASPSFLRFSGRALPSYTISISN
jgi:hypothetical protein